MADGQIFKINTTNINTWDVNNNLGNESVSPIVFSTERTSIFTKINYTPIEYIPPIKMLSKFEYDSNGFNDLPNKVLHIVDAPEIYIQASFNQGAIYSTNYKDISGKIILLQGDVYEITTNLSNIVNYNITNNSLDTSIIKNDISNWSVTGINDIKAYVDIYTYSSSGSKTYTNKNSEVSFNAKQDMLTKNYYLSPVLNDWGDLLWVSNIVSPGTCYFDIHLTGLENLSLNYFGNKLPCKVISYPASVSVRVSDYTSHDVVNLDGNIKISCSWSGGSYDSGKYRYISFAITPQTSDSRSLMYSDYIPSSIENTCMIQVTQYVNGAYNSQSLTIAQNAILDSSGNLVELICAGKTAGPFKLLSGEAMVVAKITTFADSGCTNKIWSAWKDTGIRIKIGEKIGNGKIYTANYNFG